LLIVALMNLLVGCDHEVPSSLPTTSGNEEGHGECADEPGNDSPEPVANSGGNSFSAFPANGALVDVFDMDYRQDTIVSVYQYRMGYAERPDVRILKVPTDLTGLSLCDGTGKELAGYEISGGVDSANFSAWSHVDGFGLEVIVSSGTVHLSAQRHGETRAIRFADRDEFVTAFNLYDAMVLRRESKDLNIHEQELVNVVSEWVDFVGQTPPPWYNDLSTAQYLMADQTFFDHIDGVGVSDLAVSTLLSKLCAWAGLISLVTCTLMMLCWVLVLVCVPASGVALACALAEIFS
jgi:hypothetical protein